MICPLCGEREANIHVTQVVDGQARELHLCQECAERSGLKVQEALSLPELLLGMTAAGGGSPSAPEKTCPRCHMRTGDFRKGARLGCPACYETFRDELADMLPAMHRKVVHVGKKPARHAAAPPSELASLRSRLEAAIRAEQYEEAARLRDQLRESEHDHG